MSHFQFESAIDDCLEKFCAPLTKVQTPRWQRKRNNSTSSVPLSPYNGNRSLKTPCKTPKRKSKTPLKTPKSRKTPHKTPGKTTPHVDRFIPNRTIMDNDKNYFQIVNEVDTVEINENELDPEALEKVHYEKAVKDSLEEESDPRILHFKQRAPPAREGYQNNLRVVYSQNRGSSKAKSSRYISKVPEKILDAPELMNDFYLNLVDWGSNNCIAICLGSGVYIWNYKTQATKCLLEIPNNDYLSSVSWVKDGNVLAIGCSNSLIHLWDVEVEKPLRTMLGHTGRVGSLAWNSCILSSGGRTGKIINHDVRIAEHVVSTLHEHTQDVCGLAWSPDGRMLASGGNDNLLNIWSPLVAGQLPLHSLTHHQAAVKRKESRSDQSDDQMESAFCPCKFRRLLRSTNEIVPDEDVFLKGVSWCPWQSNVLASGGGTADRYIRLWNVTTGVCLNSIDTKSQISSILWSKDYKEIITGHGFSNNQLSIWKYPSMTRVADLVDHSERVLCMSMSPCGELVASAGADETLRIWKCFDRSQLKKKSTAGTVKTLNTNLAMINRIR